MDDNKVRVIIISQQSLFRQGIILSLSSLNQMEVSGFSEVNSRVLSAIENLDPAVAIVDVDTLLNAGWSSINLLKQQRPAIGVIALSSNRSDTQIFMALRSRVAAFLSKETDAEKLAEIVARVASGERPIIRSMATHPNVAELVLTRFQEISLQFRDQPVNSIITPREREILRYLAQGLLNKQIAGNLGISEQTIKNHISSILRKMNANARTEAVILALKQGLVSV